MKELSYNELHNIQGGDWEGVRDIVDGACIIGSLLNPYVAVGCAVYGAARWAGWL